MFMVFRKKQMILTALVLMLGIAGYLNYRYDSDMQSTTVSVEEEDADEPGVGETVMVNSEIKKEEGEEEKIKIKNEDPFSAEKLKRAAARSKAREELGSILSSEEISGEIRDTTQRKLSELAAREEAEATAENLLKAKGFDKTMVYITEESVTVTVKQKGISKSDTAKIVDIIFSLTENNNIKIVEVE